MKENILITDTSTAEMVKLMENTYRDINIALANEFALMAEEINTNVWDAIDLANRHPRVDILQPGPGVGGPCLPKDPYFLIHSVNLPVDIITIARKINNYMFKHMIHLIRKALENAGKTIAKSTVAILGVAYKSNTDDSRLSPAGPIIAELDSIGVKVNVYDSHCQESFGACKAATLNKAVDNADCIVIITDHDEFKKLNLREIKSLMNCNPAIVDGRRIVNPKIAKNLGFAYYGLGLGFTAKK